MTPEQAWQAPIGQLQMEMPKATFDTWVRDVRFLSFEGGNGSNELLGSAGIFTIGLENVYARDWVESRLTSTISRMLVGILNQQVKLDFVAQPRIQEETCLEATWETVFDYLRTSASKTNFDRYIKGSRFLAYYGNNFIIGFPTNEARDWVEETINGTATHMLACMMHQPVNVQFVTAPTPQGEHPETYMESGLEEDKLPVAAKHTLKGHVLTLSDSAADILIKPVCTSLHETIVRPNKVVVVPAYFLRWLPYLGSDKGWFLIAMRQAFFQFYGKKVSSAHCGHTFTVNRGRISRWAGMGEGLVRQFLGELKDSQKSGNFLAWFMQRFQNGRGNPLAYAFCADMPLTHGDAEILRRWFLENGIRENLLETLKKALEKQPRKLLPFPLKFIKGDDNAHSSCRY